MLDQEVLRPIIHASYKPLHRPAAIMNVFQHVTACPSVFTVIHNPHLSQSDLVMCNSVQQCGTTLIYWLLQED